MLKLFVADISTLLEPSTAASATTEFAGLGNTAFEAPVAAAN